MNGSLTTLLSQVHDQLGTQLFRHVPANIAVIDPDFRVVLANGHFEQQYGGTNGAHCYEICKHRDRICEACRAKDTFRDGKVRVTEEHGVDAQGRPTVYVVHMAPLFDDAGGITNIIEMSVDMTETRRLEREKRDNERLATVGRTVAELAHSIKNILTGFQGGMHKLRTGECRKAPERIAKGWDMMDRNFVRMRTLVGGLLNLSRQHDPEVQWVKPAEVVREVCDEYREAASREGVHLTCEAAPDLTESCLDPEDMHTCLSNLVSNAIDACVASERPSCRVTLSTWEQDERLVFEVADTGCGMTPEVQQRVFDVFFTTKGSSGTGLGLAATRKIVREHGGEIEMESEPNEGSVFRVVLPRDQLPECDDPQSEETKR